MRRRMRKKVPVIVGRDASLASAESLVRGGASVDVVGGRFSGRSAFLVALQNRLADDGWHVVSVRGVASLQQHPLAAMHLAGIGGPSEGRGVSTLQLTSAALRAATHERNSVLFLDDWDDLDEASWGVAEVVRRTTGLPIVLSRLQGLRARHTPSGLEASTLEPSHVIEMLPIRFEELEVAIEQHIGDTVESGTMSRIYAKSGGIVGLATNLVDAAIRDERMKKTANGWAAVRDLWSPGLTGIVEGHLENLGDDARDALEVIALVGLADVETVRRLVSWETIELLEERALVTFVTSGNRHLVSVVPPLLVEFFRHQPRAARRIRLSELIVEKLGSDSQINLVVNSYGSSPGHDVGEGNALFVRLLQERARTRRIVANAEWVTNPRPRTASHYISALLYSDDDVAATVEQIISTTDTRSGDIAERVEFATLRAEWMAFDHHDLDGALDLLRREAVELGEAGRALDAAAVRLETMLRAVPDDFPERLEVTDGLPEPVAAALLETQMLVLVSLARFADARRAFESLGASWRQDAGSRANQLYGWVLIGEGRFEEALQWAGRGLDECYGLLDVDGVLAHGCLLALAHTVSGDYESADQVLETLFATGGNSPLLVHTQLALLAAGSVIAFRRGNISIAERYLAEIENLPVKLGPLPGQSVTWPRAQSTAFYGGHRAAAEEMWDAGEDEWNRGYRFSAMMLQLTGAEIRLPKDGLRELQRKAAEIDGDFLGAFVDYTVAKAERSPEGMIEAAKRVAAAGRLGLAMDAFKTAAAFAREARDGSTAAAAESGLQHLLESVDGRQVDTLRFLVSAVAFTDREREIAGMVARGLSNGEIARSLVVSVRTVESHVHRAMRKANLSKRSELVGYMNNLER